MKQLTILILVSLSTTIALAYDDKGSSVVEAAPTEAAFHSEIDSRELIKLEQSHGCLSVTLKSTDKLKWSSGNLKQLADSDYRASGFTDATWVANHQETKVDFIIGNDSVINRSQDDYLGYFLHSRSQGGLNIHPTQLEDFSGRAVVIGSYRNQEFLPTNGQHNLFQGQKRKFSAIILYLNTPNATPANSRMQCEKIDVNQLNTTKLYLDKCYWIDGNQPLQGNQQALCTDY